VKWGELTGMSPERSQFAVKQIIPPSNIYLQLMGSGFSKMMDGATDYEKSRITEQILAQLPGISRIVGVTHPAAKEIQQIEKAVRVSNTEKGTQHDSISAMIFREANGQGNAKEEFKAWLTTQKPEDVPKLMQRFGKEYAVDKMYRQMKVSDTIPSRTWWAQTAHADERVRADLFYMEWVKRDQTDRQQMERMAKALGMFGVGYQTTGFQEEFLRQRKQFGSEQR
jgi:hypothetical protein